MRPGSLAPLYLALYLAVAHPLRRFGIRQEAHMHMKRIKRGARPSTVRKTVVLTSDASKWIESQASQNALTFNEVIRRVIDDARGSRIREEPVR
jgi:hypothetical protein